ncbi:MAG: tryptophan 7-halogenase [Chloroflexota bacterium]
MQHSGPFDVIICGGGLAGLSLARQLRLKFDDISIMVLERLERPLPDSAFKIGESTVEQGAFYFSGILGLEDYLENEHLEKLGLRYFFGDPQGDFAQRPEFGVRTWLPSSSYHIDRGKLETHLRDCVIQAGVHLAEGVFVNKIDINKDGGWHTVHYRDSEKSLHQAQCKWVIDAMGRRRFLQSKFDLKKESKTTCNAAWFRVKGELSVDSFVPETEKAWHDKVIQDRWYSTNHLMGAGYWVWLIPLSPGNTSIGIVALDEMHRFDQYNTYEKAVAWLQKQEPVLAAHLDGYPLLDFKVLRNYSYSSHQVFSTDRWCCIGEAGVFADPFFSIGSNVLAYGNGITTKMIELDRVGQLTEQFADYMNLFYISLSDSLAETVHWSYPFHDNGVIMALKTIWDYFMGWSITDPRFYHDVYLEPTLNQDLSLLLYPVFSAHWRLLTLFKDWSKLSSRMSYDFIDYIKDVPTLTHLFLLNLPPKNADFAVIVDHLREGVERMEEFAQVVFFLAVEDVMPEKLTMFADKRWVNIDAIGLDSNRWQADGLFEPHSAPRDLSRMENEIRRLFKFEPKQVLAAT